MRLRHDTTDQPFPVHINVRSKEHEQLIVREATESGSLRSIIAEF